MYVLFLRKFKVEANKTGEVGVFPAIWSAFPGYNPVRASKPESIFFAVAKLGITQIFTQCLIFAKGATNRSLPQREGHTVFHKETE